MSAGDFDAKVGNPVEHVIKRVKDRLGVQKVRVYTDNPNSQAMSRYNGPVLEVHLPTKQTVLQQRPELSPIEVDAKIKAAAIEELCHGVFHQTDHDERVVSCTVDNMRAELTPEEFNQPYIQEKVQRLRGASRALQGTPLPRRG